MKPVIEFNGAERTSPYEVKANYTLDGTPFAVNWNCIHPETGELGDYNLGVNVESDNEGVASLVSQAILEGESEIYLTVRDTFDSSDAADVPFAVELNSVSCYEIGNGYEDERPC